ESQGCTGFRSQSSLTVHFGLGAATRADRIHILWPSDLVQDTVLNTVDQRVHVVESPTTIDTPSPPRGHGVALAAPAPNPSGGTTRFTYTLATASTMRLAIVDATGRLVRVLARGPESAGEHAMSWNGRDDAGAAVAGGVYWC